MKKSRLLIAFASLASVAPASGGPVQPEIGIRSASTLTVDSLRFRDLNHNGALDPYEDWRLSDDARARDLVQRMTLAEKAGTMMHGSLPAIGSPFGFSTEGYDLAALAPDLADRHVTSFVTRLAVSPRKMAEQNNAVQAMAEATRLGIPLTISTDPRHHFHDVAGDSISGSGYSQWPETLGFGALGDVRLMRRFGDIARAEYRATGIHQALSPQADLFTEPRWSRGTGTFGSQPAKVRALVQAYVEGFQGGASGLQRNGVLTVVKHWVGYGGTPNGWDGHNYYGRMSRATNRSFAGHVEAFKGAFRVHVAGVMPTYSIIDGVSLDGKPLEPVGAGYNSQLLTGLLRGKLGYKGIILSDWGISNDCSANCREASHPQEPQDIAMPWGVESLTKLQRIAKGINAGLDQFGGVTETDLVVDAVNKGLVSEARVNDATMRVLLPKFRMGLFENPYVDPDAAARDVGNAAFKAEGEAAQASAQVLLKNQSVFPLSAGTRVWLNGIDAGAARERGLIVVDKPEAADIALVRLSTPFEHPHPNSFFGGRQNEGRLDFRVGDAGFDMVKQLSGKTRVAVALFADRPAVLGEVNDLASAILVNFGVSDAALLDVATGRRIARGRLPFELPSSMAAVEAQDPAVPDDSRNPLYRVGAGLIAKARR